MAWRRRRTTAPVLHPGFGMRDWLGCLLLVLPFLAAQWLGAIKMHWALVALLYGYVALLLWTLFKQWLATRRPELFELSLEVRDDEFELGQRWGRKVVVRFADVTRLVALSMIDGNGESVTTLVVHCGGTTVSIRPDLLYGSGLLDRVQELPGFDAAAYASHDAEEGSLLHCLVPKRTHLLRRRR